MLRTSILSSAASVCPAVHGARGADLSVNRYSKQIEQQKIANVGIAPELLDKLCETPAVQCNVYAFQAAGKFQVSRLWRSHFLSPTDFHSTS